MLPPVDDEVLRANPAFAALYSTLTSAVLGPDGSTRRDAAAAAAARDEVSAAHPTADSSRLNRLVPSLPEHHARLVADVAAAREALAAARLRALASLSRLVACHTQALLHLVRALEAKHGLVARGLELRAADVSLRAQRTELDAAAAVHALERDVFPPPAAAALRSYAAHLRDAKLRAAERVRALQAELAEHGIGDAGDQRREETMREMARERRGISRQMEHVERDFDRRRDG